MSRIITILLATAGLLGAAQAQAADRAFSVSGFDHIRSSVPFDVRVHTGPGPSVHARGPQEALDRLIVEVVRGELVIRSQSGRWWNGWNWHRERAIIEVTVPTLVGATLSGPGDLTIDQIRTRSFGATLSGPGDLSIGSIEAAEVALVLNGPGDLTIAGRAAHAGITLRGPGDVRANGLSVRDATIALSGPGDIALSASGTVTGTLTGPGDVTIHGGARCEISKHGPGDVHCG